MPGEIIVNGFRPKTAAQAIATVQERQAAVLANHQEVLRLHLVPLVNSIVLRLATAEATITRLETELADLRAKDGV